MVVEECVIFHAAPGCVRVCWRIVMVSRKLAMRCERWWLNMPSHAYLFARQDERDDDKVIAKNVAAG